MIPKGIDITIISTKTPKGETNQQNQSKYKPEKQMGKSEKLSESYIEKDRPFCTNTNCIYTERKTKIEWIGNIYIYIP